MDKANNSNKYSPKQSTGEKTIKEIEAETTAWINNNEKVKEYLSHFRASDAEEFAKKYPALKASFMHYGAALGDLPDLMQEGYIETAADRLMDIQRKKLFDLMCQWDAELIKLDGIEVFIDFTKWNKNIEDCPYLTPISQDEFILYMLFANTEAFEKDIDIPVYHYNAYRNEEESFESIPAWFEYEDAYTGNGKYKRLPRLRTKKEAVYTKLYHKEKDEEINKKYETGELEKYVLDERPEILVWHYNHIEQFIKANETDKEVLRLFRKHYAYFTDQLIRDNEEEEEDGWLTEQAQNIIDQLSGIKEKIAVKANRDWRVALIEGFAAYEKNKVLQALPYAYDNYLMRKQIGITSSTINDDNSSDLHIIEIVRHQILRGRELNGEPRDFNF